MSEYTSNTEDYNRLEFVARRLEFIISYKKSEQPPGSSVELIDKLKTSAVGSYYNLLDSQNVLGDGTTDELFSAFIEVTGIDPNSASEEHWKKITKKYTEFTKGLV